MPTPSPKADSPELSVVLPAFNEESRVGAALERIMDFLDGRRSFELWVVNDGSADGTAAVAEPWVRRDPRVHLLRLRTNFGKGAALHAGISRTTGRWVLATDVDLSAPIEELAELEKWAGFSDVVIGSRALKESRLETRQPARRERLGRWFNAAARIVAIPGILDSQCGFKLWRGEAARAVFRRSLLNRFAFDVETLWMARSLGYRIRETPVRWSHDSRSTVRVGRDGARMVADLIRVLLRRSLGS